MSDERTKAERKADEASAEVRALEAEKARLLPLSDYDLDRRLEIARRRRTNAWRAVRQLRESTRV